MHRFINCWKNHRLGRFLFKSSQLYHDFFLNCRIHLDLGDILYDIEHEIHDFYAALCITLKSKDFSIKNILITLEIQISGTIEINVKIMIYYYF